jgi:hypothetical protein
VSDGAVPPVVRIPEAIREQLRLALVDEGDFLEFLGQARPEPLAERPGWSRCRCILPVRRPLDPETSQLVPVEILLRPSTDAAWEVDSIRGLEAQLP